MAPVPESNTTDELQPAPKKHRGIFSALIDAPVHDVTPVACSLTTPDSPEAADPLSSWKCHASKYTFLAKLVSKLLCIPAQSAPVERLFSTGGRVGVFFVVVENFGYLRCNEKDS